MSNTCNFDKSTCVWKKYKIYPAYPADWVNTAHVKSGLRGHGSKGKFMAVVGRDNRSVRAALASPDYQQKYDVCVHLFYALARASLFIALKGQTRAKKSKTTVYWTARVKDTSEGLVWKEQSMTIPESAISHFTSYRAVIWAEVNDSNSVAAIDDVTLTFRHGNDSEGVTSFPGMTIAHVTPAAAATNTTTAAMRHLVEPYRADSSQKFAILGGTILALIYIIVALIVSTMLMRGRRARHSFKRTASKHDQDSEELSVEGVPRQTDEDITKSQGFQAIGAKETPPEATAAQGEDNPVSAQPGKRKPKMFPVKNKTL